MSQTTFTRPLNDILVRLTVPHVVADGVLTVGDTSAFGSISPTSPVRVTVRNGFNNTLAIYKVTGSNATQLLINSAIENTTDIAFPANAQVTVDFTAGHLQDAYDAINALEVKPDHITIGAGISGGIYGGILYQSGVSSTVVQDTGLIYNGFDDTLSTGNLILSGYLNVKGVAKNILYVNSYGYLEQNDTSFTWDYNTHTFGVQAKSGQTENVLEVKNFSGSVVCRITPTGSIYGDGSHLTGVELPSNKGVAFGYASLDSGAKIPTSQLPASILGAVSYQGVWNASTNSPTLASGVGTKGYYYKVSVAGSTSVDGNVAWAVGDWIVYDGVAWEQVNSHDAVVSVNGMTGVVTGLVQITGAQTITGLKTFQASAGNVKGLIVQGSTSQTANFIDCLYSNNAAAFTIDVNGIVNTVGNFVAPGGFSSTSPQNGLTLATSSVGNSWQIFGDNSTGFYASSNGLAVRFGSVTAALQIASSGNRVGFNTLPVTGQQLTILSSGAATKNLVLQASPSQTADFIQLLDSTSAVKAKIDAGGNVTATSYYGDGSNLTGVFPAQTSNAGKYLTTNGSVVSWATVVGMGIGNAVSSGTANSILFVDSSGNLGQNVTGITWDDASHKFVIRGKASQSVNLMEYQDSAGSVVLGVDGAGFLRYGTTSVFAGVNTLLHTAGNLGATGAYGIRWNIFVGVGAGNTTNAGAANTGVGTLVLSALTTGEKNVAVGSHSMLLNTTGTLNTACGVDSLESNTTGNNNAALGYGSLANNITGNNNVAGGYTALFHHASGDANTAFGYWALLNDTTGVNNVAFGAFSGNSNTDGTNNTYLGMNSGNSGSSDHLTNVTTVGYNTQVTQSNSLILGNGAKVAIGNTAPAAWTHITIPSSGDIGFIVDGALGQTADFVRVRDSSGTTFLSVPALAAATNYTSLKINNTLPSGRTAQANGVDITITPQGSDSQNVLGLSVNLAAGYTGPWIASGGSFFCLSKSTGVLAWTNSFANYGNKSSCSGTTAGNNVGLYGQALNSTTLNIGSYGRAITAVASSINIGIAGAAINTGASGVHVAGHFYIGSTAPPTPISTVVLVDNASSASTPLFLGRVNGITAFTINSNGAVIVNPVSASVVSLIVKGATSQSADLFQAQDSTGAVLARVGPGGGGTFSGYSYFNGLRINGADPNNGIFQTNVSTQIGICGPYGISLAYNSANGGDLVVPIGGGVQCNTYLPTVRALTVRGAPSQSANLFECQDSVGGVLSYIAPNGDAFLGSLLTVNQASTGNTGGIRINQGVGGAVRVADLGYSAYGNYYGDGNPNDFTIRTQGNLDASIRIDYYGSVTVHSAYGKESATLNLNGPPLATDTYAISMTAVLEGPRTPCTSGYISTGFINNTSATYTGYVALAAQDFNGVSGGREGLRIVSDSAHPLTSIGGASPLASTTLTVVSPASTYKGLVVKGATSQSANLFECQNSTGTALASISSSGVLKFPASVCGVTAATDASTITFDCSTANIFTVTLGGNRTLVLSNDQIGQTFELILKQDATGSRTVTWWSGILWQNGTTPALTTTANKSDIFTFQKIASGVYLGFVVGQNY